MARVTVEDCLEHEENRFALVLLAAQRTRQIMKGVVPLVPSKNKPAVSALREIAGMREHDAKNPTRSGDWGQRERPVDGTKPVHLRVSHSA